MDNGVDFLVWSIWCSLFQWSEELTGCQFPIAVFVDAIKQLFQLLLGITGYSARFDVCIVCVFRLSVLRRWNRLTLFAVIKRFTLKFNFQIIIEYLFQCLKVLEAEFIDVFRLVAKDLSCEIVEDVWETLGDWVFLQVLACHRFYYYLLYS